MNGTTMQDVLSIHFHGHQIPTLPGEIVQVSEVMFVRGEVHGYFLHLYDIGDMWCGNIIEDMTFTCIQSYGGFTNKQELWVEMLTHISSDVKPTKSSFKPTRPERGGNISSLIDNPLPGELADAGVIPAGYGAIGITEELDKETVNAR